MTTPLSTTPPVLNSPFPNRASANTHDKTSNAESIIPAIISRFINIHSFAVIFSFISTLFITALWDKENYCIGIRGCANLYNSFTELHESPQTFPYPFLFIKSQCIQYISQFLRIGKGMVHTHTVISS